MPFIICIGVLSHQSPITRTFSVTGPKSVLACLIGISVKIRSCNLHGCISFVSKEHQDVGFDGSNHDFIVCNTNDV